MQINRQGQIKCEICGMLFVPKEPHFKTCFNCHSNQFSKPVCLDPGLLLQSYYDKNGNLVKDVYIGKPKEIAEFFCNNGLTTKQLREIHSFIARARNNCILKGIASSRHILWECQSHLAYQLKRNKVPESFVKFFEHHATLAEIDEKNLEGFYQHFDSIVCYFPKERRG